jgi:catechol 2,3-dioxygenase-like lactoylglutathione lyase family enzyme
MSLVLAQLALVVRDYDEAIAWYTQALGFALLEDTPLGAGKRWVVVAPPGPAADANGTVAVFEDLYGNRWDLVERRPVQ